RTESAGHALATARSPRPRKAVPPRGGPGAERAPTADRRPPRPPRKPPPRVGRRGRARPPGARGTSG
ncbi:hypothetical protein Nmel_007151, partial [Mimus melanotis]